MGAHRSGGEGKRDGEGGARRELLDHLGTITGNRKLPTTSSIIERSMARNQHFVTDSKGHETHVIRSTFSPGVERQTWVRAGGSVAGNVKVTYDTTPPPKLSKAQFENDGGGLKVLEELRTEFYREIKKFISKGFVKDWKLEDAKATGAQVITNSYIYMKYR